MLEPLLLGLLIAPSKTGLCLAGACLAAFLCRRPLKIALAETRPERRAAARRALAGGAIVMLAALAAAGLTGGTVWWGWLAPAAVAAGFFLFFDLRGAAREEAAEIAGAMTFAFLPGAMGAAAGWAPASAAALVVLAAGRALPTVLFVRAYLRSAKTGRARRWPALAAAGLALGGGIWLYAASWAPLSSAVALAVLFCRSTIYLVFPRPVMTARNIGRQELILGAAFVLSLALTWRAPIR